jgi:hypothetical protein
MRTSYIVGAVVLAVVLIAAVSFWPSEEPADVVPEMPVAAPVAQPQAQPVVEVRPRLQPEAERLDEQTPAALESPLVAPAPELPELHASDDFVREQILDWGLPEPWLANEALVARLTVVLTNAADGDLPRSQLGFLTPTKPFKAIARGERWFIDPSSYRRFDGLVDVLEAVPPSALAEFVILIEPLIDQALGQLGRRDATRDLVSRAVARIVSARTLDGEVELVRPAVMYEFADPALEALPELDKQLLRIGPGNTKRVQRIARAFADAYRVAN